MNIIKITTEGDCEGRTTKTLGHFYGSIDQAVAYCKANGLTPCYHYRADPLNVTDVSELEVGTFKTKVGQYGRITTSGVLPQELLREAKISAIMNKLTEEEKELLGLK